VRPERVNKWPNSMKDMMMMMINTVKMEDIKIINARQSKATRAYKNTNQNLVKNESSSLVKKRCRSNHLTSKYVNLAGSCEKIVNKIHNKH
jgi:hypothetical protein